MKSLSNNALTWNVLLSFSTAREECVSEFQTHWKYDLWSDLFVHAEYMIEDRMNKPWANLKPKDWLAIATLKPTFTFLGRDFAIFNTFTWQNPYQKSESESCNG